jgi:hypothetical protein
LWIGLLAGALLLLLQEGTITNHDGQVVFGVTRSIVERRSLAVAPEQYDVVQGDDRYLSPEVYDVVPGEDGRYYGRFGIGLSLLALPPYLAVQPIAQLSKYEHYLEEAAVASIIPLLSALLIVALFRLSRRLGAGVNSSLLVAGGAVCGTFALPYTKDFLSELPTALFVAVAIERTLARRPVQASAALGMACLLRPQEFALVPLFVWAVWRSCGIRRVFAGAIPIVVAGVVSAAYNIARFGNPIDFGYTRESMSMRPGFTTPLLEGLGGLLFHPGTSIFLFAPAVVLLPLALWELGGRNRIARVLIAGNLLITLLIASVWVSGGGWGPRLLITGIVPAIVSLAPWGTRTRRRRVAVATLFVLGFALSAATTIVPTSAQQLDRPVPERGPRVIRQIELIPRTTNYTLEHLYEPAETAVGEHRRYLNLWQVNAARQAGKAGLAGASLLSAALVALVVVAALRLRVCRRELRRCLAT